MLWTHLPNERPRTAVPPRPMTSAQLINETHHLLLGIQEAFQLVDNAANVFYGIVYLMLFAIPIAGASAIRSGAPIWLRIAAISGAAVSLLAIFFTVYPIIDVPNPLAFGAKIAAATIIANAIGVGIYLVSTKRRRTGL